MSTKIDIHCQKHQTIDINQYYLIYKGLRIKYFGGPLYALERRPDTAKSQLCLAFSRPLYRLS